MARKTKAPTRRSTTRKKPATTKAKATTRKAGSRKGKATASRGTEVERNWATYLKQRTALEQAVAAVQAADSALSSAREIEASRRKEFDESKASLEQLLEVERASDPRHNVRRKPVDVPVPAKPAKFGADQELSLG